MIQTQKKDRTIEILVSKLTSFHTVQLEDGSWQRIQSVGRGMSFGTLLIHYANGEWGNIPTKQVTLALQTDYGYDVGSQSWIIGNKTDTGTIAIALEYFDTATQAEAKCNELNKIKKQS